MRLAIVSNYLSIDYIKQNYPKSHIIECSDDLIALLKTSFSETDGTVIDLLTASYIVEKYGITNLALGTELGFKWELRFATRKELPELFSILNKLLNTISFEERENIYKKWVSINALPQINNYERFSKIFIYALIILIFLMASSTIIIYILKREVKRQTNELEKAKIIAEKK